MTMLLSAFVDCVLQSVVESKNTWCPRGRLHQLDVKKLGVSQVYDKYLHLLHQLKLRSGATTPGVDDARPRWHILPQL